MHTKENWFLFFCLTVYKCPVKFFCLAVGDYGSTASRRLKVSHQRVAQILKLVYQRQHRTASARNSLLRILTRAW